MSAKLRDRDDWFDLWYDDKTAVLDTMVRNMVSDIAHGYSYLGNFISRQKKAIDDYKAEMDNQMMAFADMDEDKVNRWCFYDMKRRGAIS